MGKGLELEKVTLRLHGAELLSLSLAVSPGEVVTVMGPSGAGKSALLGYLSGTLDPVFEACGHVRLNGRALDDLPPEERRVGLLFQDDLLFPHLSVAGNLGFGLKPGGNRAAIIDAALADAGLAGFGPRDPATLSGGQRARVSLLRVLLSQPEALLLDEPFSKLDPALRAQFRHFVFEKARAAGLPVLMVTHDADDAKAADGPVLRVGGLDDL